MIKKDGNSDIRLTIKTNKDVDMRRNNTPASSEIAVLLPGDGMEASNRDIVLHKKGGVIIRINEFNAAYDPLHYVLLFPHSDQGYYFNIKPNQLPEVSMDIVQKLLMQPQMQPKNQINRVENIENSIQQVNIIRNNIENENIESEGNLLVGCDDEIENIQVEEYLVEDAESVNIKKDKTKITTMDHYAHRLMIRKNTQQLLWFYRFYSCPFFHCF